MMFADPAKWHCDSTWKAGILHCNVTDIIVRYELVCVRWQTATQSKQQRFGWRVNAVQHERRSINRKETT